MFKEHKPAAPAFSVFVSSMVGRKNIAYLRSAGLFAPSSVLIQSSGQKDSNP